MKISSSFDNIDSGSKRYQSFKGVPQNPSYIPEAIGNVAKVAGEYINTPEQKLFLATAALMFQPLIDLKYAKDDQKIDAAIKSASKAMAGGFTGVLIRASFLKLTDHFIGFQKHNKLNRLFFPDAAIKLKEVRPEIAKLRIKQYSQTLGTLFAVLFMILFSNSHVDVPLTSDIQDLISGVVKDKKSWLTSLNDVKNNRCKKITDWFKRKKDIINKVKNKIVGIVNVLNEDTTTGDTAKPQKKESEK